MKGHCVEENYIFREEKEAYRFSGEIQIINHSFNEDNSLEWNGLQDINDCSFDLTHTQRQSIINTRGSQIKEKFVDNQMLLDQIN